jgi:hypothetical protein
MIKKFWIYIICGLLLSACTKTSPHYENKAMISDNNIAMKIKQFWPLKMQGNYLQKIDVLANAQHHDFFVHVSVNKDKLHAVAYNDMIGRLYSLTWTKQGIYWQPSNNIPAFVQPDNIILDFLLVHLPLATLNKNILDAKIVDHAAVRTVTNGNLIVRKITREEPIGSSWKKIIIHNPQVNYTLTITTVKLE